MPSDRKQPAGARAKRNTLTIVLLVITGGIVALTIVIATRPGPVRRPDEPISPADERDQVLSLVSRLLATADQLAPSRPDARDAAYRQVRELMETYVRTHPEDVTVRTRLAEVLVLMGLAKAAEVRVDEILERRPGSAGALWMKGYLLQMRGGEGYEQYLRRAADSPDADANIWSLYGLGMLKAGRIATAEEYLRKAYRQGAKDPATLCALARLAFVRDRFEEAEKYLSLAVKHKEAGAVAWGMLAEVQKETGRLDEAADSVMRAIGLLSRPTAVTAGAPDKGDLLLLLGQVRLLQQRHQQAAEAFAEASDYTFVRAPAALNAAKCYYFLGRHAQAMKFIDIAAGLMPKGPAVAEWVKKIEDARFGAPAPASQPLTMPWSP
ncbi:MAG TPA: tetratricopeptide repeat protein [Phycisphaerae bacterium]|nr:tetratricopeptide repeat protein [Phycisphaerae bacterium]